MRELVVGLIFAKFESVKKLADLQVTGQLVWTLPRVATDGEAAPRRASLWQSVGVDQFVSDLLDHGLYVLEIGSKAVNA